MVVIVNKERVRIGIVLLFLAVVAAGIGVVAVRVNRLRNDPDILNAQRLVARSRDTSRRVEVMLAAGRPFLMVAGASSPTWVREDPVVVAAPDVVPVSPAPIKSVSVDEAIRLTGVAWSEERPLAFINGAVFGVGDVVSGFAIRLIASDRVVLVGNDGLEHTVPLYKE